MGLRVYYYKGLKLIFLKFLFVNFFFNNQKIITFRCQKSRYSLPLNVLYGLTKNIKIII